MKSKSIGQAARLLALAVLIVAATAAGSQAKIDGITGTSFDFTAQPGYILAGDGQPIFIWGLSETGQGVQYPAPTLIVGQGDIVTIVVRNQLPEPTSLLFPGQNNVTATGGIQGLVTREAPPGGTVTYTFTASQPGTYYYQSGSDISLQVEMGLLGALIVRPSGFVPGGEGNPDTTAYGTEATRYDQEVLYFNTEMDHRIHKKVEQGMRGEVDNNGFFPYYWFYNGRNSPDVFSPSYASWLAAQPYDCFPRMHPNERLLLRIVGGGRDMHPLHHHGNSGRLIAMDGRPLETAAGLVDAGPKLFTETVVPGQTMDVIFDPWTGADLGWDVHDHVITDPMKDYEVMAESALTNAITTSNGINMFLEMPGVTEFPKNRYIRLVLWDPAAGSLVDDSGREIITARYYNPYGNPQRFRIIKRHEEGTTAKEWPAGTMVTYTYHGSPFPVTLPDQKDLTPGQFYSGSPFLGAKGALPPGEGGYNVNNGLAYMFHSHNEKEMTNNNVFPGGMMTMMIVEPEGVIIEHSPF